MSDTRPVQMFSSGPPETVLDSETAESIAALAVALAANPPNRTAAISAVAAQWPTFLDAWARLGEAIAVDPTRSAEAYACFRTGYHRGLDRLRQSGWRGSGYVRWAHETNRGFLRALDGLRSTAAAIGETPEAERCAIFIEQLTPGGIPTSDA